MTAPLYTTDLTTIATGDLNVDAGVWDESSDGGWDTGGAMVDDQNLYYNNAECVSAQMTKDSNGSGATGPATIMYEHTAAFTIPADGAALIHHLWAAPPALNTLANAGIIVLAGTTLGDFYGWNASGSDFAPAPRGGWANYAINPAIGSPDHTVGTITTYNMIGMAVAATAQARGNPNACNAVRYGRCTSIYEHGDLANGYATFSGYADIDSIITNKWNLLDPIKGGYEHQGLMSLGTATNLVDFRDSSKNISIANTINVTSAFNRIEVHNASSNIEWTAISISALGINSIGTFEAIDNATIAKTACTFTDMGTFIYQSNSTLLNNIRRRCSQVTQGGATITGETFDLPTGTVGLLADTIALVTLNTFNSDGTGHAVNLGNITTTQAVTWNNFESGYVAGVTGSPITTGTSGNETILCNVSVGEVLTINVADGASTPSVKNDGTGTVNVVAGQFDFIVSGLELDTEVTILTAGTQTELYHVEDASVSDGAGKYKITYTHSGGETVDILIHHIHYVPDISNIYNLTLASAAGSAKVQMFIDPYYNGSQ